MSFLRIGTACVVTNDEGQFLLSQRGDLGTWGVPGGRLDKGERLEDAALREVREETGIEVEVERPVGLYYVTRWQRLNVMFKGRAVGGQLLGRTHEALDNRWFARDALPESLSEAQRQPIAGALSGETVLRVIDTPLDEYRRLRRQFAWRWVKNLLSGRPEPRYPRFRIETVLISGAGRVVERYVCSGQRAPWQEFVYEHRPPSLQLDNIAQDTVLRNIRFIFATATKGVPVERGVKYAAD
jgi:ADP-ribose pyrophosphatase YjhB (NUDIX family)